MKRKQTKISSRFVVASQHCLHNDRLSQCDTLMTIIIKNLHEQIQEDSWIKIVDHLIKSEVIVLNV